ncbi:hypothetical protein [Sphingobacterium paludis]|uniref:Uncharacterized protein n=1 Tax=Sphingobacterium paludis TaxID=1476465 RepID=A0A4R7CSW5_9SPHI|nr:hypothetical protein [Sphingobacterium paludis]TDS11111.1 hypothetical protein B0I21_108171 [Sphingobacterium paludis]
MENFLPVLLIVAGVVYKIYTEYQKEQEKASKRRPNVPPTNTVPPFPNPEQYKKTQLPPFPKPTRSVPPPKPAPVKVDMQPRPIEVTNVQEQKKVRKEARRIEALKAPKLEVITQEHIDFDLRRAIIQSAILERPYRD